jgi:6-pyruvoyltetrahydropterin/6-carboxytetrahydropterin synthase
MLDVSRTVRFCVDFDESAAAHASARRDNTFAGWPSLVGLGAYYELTVTCRGEPDATTGYLVEIGEIDRAIRAQAIPLVEQAVRTQRGRATGDILRQIIRGLPALLPRPVRSVRWQLTPYHSLSMATHDQDRILIRQRFEFAAAHRLHVDSMSAEENRSVFGKCNAQHGHGHNYRMEVAVSATLDDGGRARLSLPDLEAVVARTIIDRFDHTNLNLDTEEFRTLNPSVEHITRVCHDRLAGPVAEAGGRLEEVTVWETEKTSCTYPAPPLPR